MLFGQVAQLDSCCSLHNSTTTAGMEAGDIYAWTDVSMLPLNNKAQLCGSSILCIAEVGGELLVACVGGMWGTDKVIQGPEFIEWSSLLVKSDTSRKEKFPSWRTLIGRYCSFCHWSLKTAATLLAAMWCFIWLAWIFPAVEWNAIYSWKWWGMDIFVLIAGLINTS